MVATGGDGGRLRPRWMPAPDAVPRGRTQYAPVLAVAALGALVSVRDPHVPGAWAVCPTYAALGVFCPGCGSLRALHDLVAGRFAESVGHNALVVPGLAFLLYAAFRRPGSRWGWLWLAVFGLFTLARNLPGSPLAP